MIRSNFDLLRVQKERKDNRKLPYRVIADETRLSTSTLVRLMNNQFDRVDIATLDTLCDYFGCAVGELLEHVPNKKEGGS